MDRQVCIVCNGDNYSDTLYGGYIYDNKKYHIVKCVKCGFMFLNPLPSFKTLKKVYEEDDYFEKYYATPDGIKGYIEGMINYTIYDEMVICLIKGYKESGRLLDIGCAGGRFLVNARKLGYTVFGIEPNPKMSDYAKNELRLNVVCGTLENLSFKGGYFDIIHAADVLEHILELKRAVEIIKKLLADDGILVIEQPLMYNKSFFNLFLKINMLFKENSYTKNPPAHLWEFNSTTLKYFLERMGFEIVYYGVSESMAKPLTVYKKPTIKNMLGHYIKNISSVISNNPMLKGFNMGDRAIVICKKANGIL